MATAPSAGTVQITATRFGETTQSVPGAISVVTGEEMRARGANTLRTALALMPGVSVAPGGDAGPASAVPGLLGVREVDDLLLLIDGVPAGGAFSPQVEAVSLVNVERIEVLRGSAPVYYGTTAFAGTINIIHYAAGQADQSLTIGYGSKGSLAASGAVVLSTGPIKQSLSLDLSDNKVADPRAGYQRAQGQWRAAAELGGGQARADLHVMSLRQKPDSPSAIDDSTGQLTTVLPKDFNQNPANAKLNTDRYQLVLGYDLPLSFGRWGNTLSYTDTRNDNIRGFIDMGDTPQPWTNKTVADVEANRQTRTMRDLFIDSHITAKPLTGLDLTAGANLLLGEASAHSLRYAHKLPFDGQSQVPDLASVSPKTDVSLKDKRRFLGLYAQTRYQLSPDASLLAGLRYNSTHESRDEDRITLRTNALARTAVTQDNHRWSGSLGGQWKAWQSTTEPINALTLHASLGHTFQPAQLDFNPNPEVGAPGGAILKPETQSSLIFGLKADALGGMAEFDIDGFWVDFKNQPVQGVTSAGTAALFSAGAQRYKGLDIEGTLRPAPDWRLRGSLTWSDARYRDFVTDVDGTSTQLAGKQQVLTPQWRGALGLVWAPARGLRASLTSSYTGKHWLNRLNTHRGEAYAVVDATIGYRFEAITVTLAGANLGNRRDAAQLSDLGDEQFYRLPARRLDLSVNVAFK